MKRTRTGALVALSSLACAFVAQAQTGDAAAVAADFRAQRDAVKGSGTGKLNLTLRNLQSAQEARANVRSRSAVEQASRHPLLMLKHGQVVVDAVAQPGQAEVLRAELVKRGLQGASVYGNVVSGRLPAAAIKEVSGVASLRFMRPSVAVTNAGLTTTQGDRSLNSDTARAAFGVDGAGIRVGSLSDSFNCTTVPLVPGNPHTTAEQDIANGDLPEDIIVLKEDPACSDEADIDEGRAMMQIIHDVAPGAAQAFHTAFDGEADFANGIVRLAVEAGSDVIVDDVSYLAEPMFQDGIIAQAVDLVKSKGIAYFTAAGNRARQSYEAPFRASGVAGAAGEQHDFDPGAGLDTFQTITLTPGAQEILSFQWDQPFASVSGAPGATSDLDVVWYELDGSLVPFCDELPDGTLVPDVCQIPGIDPNIGADPVELSLIQNFTGAPVQVTASFEIFDGDGPGLIKYVYFDNGAGDFIVDEFDTQSPSNFGHSNAAGAEAVGAAPWYNTEEFPPGFWPECKPACAATFSAAGGTPILFDINGNRLEKPIIRKKPGVVGPDGGNSTFFLAPIPFEVPGTSEPDEFPNFFGTSASAPHVAAVAALMYDKIDQGIATDDGLWTVCAKGRHGRQTLQLAPAIAALRIASGAQFRACGAIKPQKIYNTLRQTAEDMKYRSGRLVPPTKVGNKGFDFDTGFGFVNAVKALEAICPD